MERVAFNIRLKPEIQNIVQQQPVLDDRLLQWVGACARPLLQNAPSYWKLEIK